MQPKMESFSDLFLNQYMPLFGALEFSDQVHVLVVPDHSASLPYVAEWIARHSRLAIIDMRTAQVLAHQRGVYAEFGAERKEFGIRVLLDRLYRTEGEPSGSHVVFVVSELLDKELMAEILLACEKYGAKCEVFRPPGV